MDENLFNYFPQTIKNAIYGQVENFEGLEEIRLRNNKPIILKFTNEEIVTNYYITYKEMMDVLRQTLREFYLFISKSNMYRVYYNKRRTQNWNNR